MMSEGSPGLVERKAGHLADYMWRGRSGRRAQPPRGSASVGHLRGERRAMNEGTHEPVMSELHRRALSARASLGRRSRFACARPATRMSRRSSVRGYDTGADIGTRPDRPVMVSRCVDRAYGIVDEAT